MRVTIFAFGLMMVLLGLWGKTYNPAVALAPSNVYNVEVRGGSALDCSKSSPYEPKDACND